MPIAMAASFDEPLVYEVFTAVSDEARVKERQALQAAADPAGQPHEELPEVVQHLLGLAQL